MDTVKESLSNGEPVQLGFCNFEVGNRSERQARNFKTKEIMHIPGGATQTSVARGFTHKVSIHAPA